MPQGWLPDDDARARAGSATGCGCSGRCVGARRCSALFAGADLFAFPSRHEGFGIPVLEAMAQGTPVVCSDIPAFREVAGDAARFVARRRRRRAAPTRIGTLLADGDARAALVGAGASTHVQAYSWERCADATIAVYREALTYRSQLASEPV